MCLNRENFLDSFNGRRKKRKINFNGTYLLLKNDRLYLRVNKKKSSASSFCAFFYHRKRRFLRPRRLIIAIAVFFRFFLCMSYLLSSTLARLLFSCSFSIHAIINLLNASHIVFLCFLHKWRHAWWNKKKLLIFHYVCMNSPSNSKKLKSSFCEDIRGRKFLLQHIGMKSFTYLL